MEAGAQVNSSLMTGVQIALYTWGAGWLSGSFSDDAEQELWDVLGSNPALHP